MGAAAGQEGAFSSPKALAWPVPQEEVGETTRTASDRSLASTQARVLEWNIEDCQVKARRALKKLRILDRVGEWRLRRTICVCPLVAAACMSHTTHTGPSIHPESTEGFRMNLVSHVSCKSILRARVAGRAQSGDFVAVLGPSGCGESSPLAGLHSMPTTRLRS
jgi:hypothetical protein